MKYASRVGSFNNANRHGQIQIAIYLKSRFCYVLEIYLTKRFDLKLKDVDLI